MRKNNIYYFKTTLVLIIILCSINITLGTCPSDKLKNGKYVIYDGYNFYCNNDELFKAPSSTWKSYNAHNIGIEEKDIPDAIKNFDKIYDHDLETIKNLNNLEMVLKKSDAGFDSKLSQITINNYNYYQNSENKKVTVTKENDKTTIIIETDEKINQEIINENSKTEIEQKKVRDGLLSGSHLITTKEIRYEDGKKTFEQTTTDGVTTIREYEGGVETEKKVISSKEGITTEKIYEPGTNNVIKIIEKSTASGRQISNTEINEDEITITTKEGAYKIENNKISYVADEKTYNCNLELTKCQNSEGKDVDISGYQIKEKLKDAIAKSKEVASGAGKAETPPPADDEPKSSHSDNPPPRTKSMSDYEKCSKNSNCKEGYASKNGEVYKSITIKGPNGETISREVLVDENSYGQASIEEISAQSINAWASIFSEMSDVQLKEWESTISEQGDTNAKVGYAFVTKSSVKDLVDKIDDKNTLLLIIEKGTEQDAKQATDKYIGSSSKEELKDAFKKIDSENLRRAIIENVLTNSKSDVSVEDLCNANSKACGRALLAASLEGEGIGEEAQKQLIKMAEKGKIEITTADAAKIMYEGDVSGENIQKLAAASQGRDCDKGLGVVLCTITQQQTSRQMYLSGLTNGINELKQDQLVAPEAGVNIGGKTKWFGLAQKKGETVCEGIKVSSNECQDQIENACTKNDKTDTKCVQDANAKIISLSHLPNPEETNQNILENFARKSDLKLKSKYCQEKTFNNEECLKDLEQQVKQVCDESDDRCSYLKAGLNKALGLQVVDVGWGYSIATALKNPDQGGLKAAKYFGFEANYSNLPDWLKQDMATSICSSKIDGYLDKELENNGGMTQYGCENDLDRRPSDLCTTVLADIRAQRSEITPDNKTLITYSYYLKAPEESDIIFIVASAYRLADGEVVKNILVNITNVTKGEIAKGFDTVELPVKSREGAINKSFRIAIGAFYKPLEATENTGDINPQSKVYVNLAAPILLATPEAYNLEYDRAEGNAAAQEQADSSDPLSANDLLELLEY